MVSNTSCCQFPPFFKREREREIKCPISVPQLVSHGLHVWLKRTIANRISSAIKKLYLSASHLSTSPSLPPTPSTPNSSAQQPSCSLLSLETVIDISGDLAKMWWSIATAESTACAICFSLKTLFSWSGFFVLCAVCCCLATVPSCASMYGDSSLYKRLLGSMPGFYRTY